MPDQLTGRIMKPCHPLNSDFHEQLRWLAEKPARASFDYALQFCRKDAYGLDPHTVAQIQSHDVESISVAKAWLRARIPEDEYTVRVVLGESEVFIASTRFFLERCLDLFCPGRDDAVVLADRADWVLFYNHEVVIEVGWRRGLEDHRRGERMRERA